MRQRGFSLVELAIVLVIIGLITGGILTGQDLIRASEMNSVISDYNKYTTAANTFKLKYNAFPGDISNATSYWGTASGGCPNGAGTGTQTCNGDFDGFMENHNETYRAWQHLALAGLIPGTYSGTHSGGGSVLGTNTPESRIKAAGWGWYYSAGPWGITIPLRNNMVFGAATASDAPVTCSVLTPAEAMSIDTKMDDGKPSVGNMITGCGGCVDNITATATYTVSNSASVCAFLIKM